MLIDDPKTRREPVDDLMKYRVALHAALIVYELDSEILEIDPVTIGGAGVGTVVLIANSHHGGFSCNQVLEAADYIGMPRMLAQIIDKAERRTHDHERDVREVVIGVLGYREKYRLPYLQRLAKEAQTPTAA